MRKFFTVIFVIMIAVAMSSVVYAKGGKGHSGGMGSAGGASSSGGTGGSSSSGGMGSAGGASSSGGMGSAGGASSSGGAGSADGASSSGGMGGSASSGSNGGFGAMGADADHEPGTGIDTDGDGEADTFGGFQGMNEDTDRQPGSGYMGGTNPDYDPATDTKMLDLGATYNDGTWTFPDGTEHVPGSGDMIGIGAGDGTMPRPQNGTGFGNRWIDADTEEGFSTAG